MASEHQVIVDLSEVQESIYCIECYFKLLCLTEIPEAGYLGLALLKDLENKLEVMTKIDG